MGKKYRAHHTRGDGVVDLLRMKDYPHNFI